MYRCLECNAAIGICTGGSLCHSLDEGVHASKNMKIMFDQADTLCRIVLDKGLIQSVMKVMHLSYQGRHYLLSFS
jgi:hypothetical protein